VRALGAAAGVALVLALGASGSTRRSSAVFAVDARQAGEVTTVVSFLRAYNARKLGAALALVTSDVVGSDCDYRHRKTILFSGKKQFTAWLRGRFADRDRLTLARIWNENREQGGVVGVDYAKRESETLRALGAVHGTVPKSATKVVFDRAGRIRSFANGPGGAPPDVEAKTCSP
jgi:hypothetical protein